MAKAERAAARIALEHSLADLITEAREAANVTQVELARRLGQPQSLIAKIETCARRISAVDLLLVARALGCDAGRLLDELAATLPEPKQHVQPGPRKGRGRARDKDVRIEGDGD